VGTGGGIMEGAMRGAARAAAAAWTLLILVVMLVPVPAVPGAPGGLDKAVHFLLFAVETVLIRAADARGRLVPAVLGAAALAAATELAQGPLPYRTLEPGDLAADAAGIAVSSLVLVLGYAVRRREER